MQDKDIEENYHAQFMQQALRQAGFDSKILRGLDELRWDDAGQLIDGDGRTVNCVWKTLGVGNRDRAGARGQRNGVCRSAHPYRAYQSGSAFDRRATTPGSAGLRASVDGDHGNKAILPILWQLFPHHRYLLDTDFTVNEELARTGYAVKPIAGRCGSNIDLVSHREELWIKPAVSLLNRRTFISSFGVCRRLPINIFRFVPSP